MPAYDALRYDPPAPVAIVALRHPLDEVSVGNVPLLIDTGADATLLPRWAVSQLGVAPQAGYEVVSFDGSRSTADAVDLDMLFLNKAFRGRYLVSDDEHGILGRDVLAALRLMFNGPAQEWSQAQD